MKTTIIRDRTACKELWERWSPKESLYHLWEYREPFLDVFGYELAFTLFQEGEEEIGMFPLWFNKELTRYFWFGDTGDEFDWQEDNMFWVKDTKQIPEMLSLAPRPLHLTALTPEAATQIEGTEGLVESFPKSVMPLVGIENVEKYLEGLPKKIRQNTKRDQRRIDALGLTLQRDRRADFAKLMEMNTGNFDDSPFHDKRLYSVFEKITQQTSPNTYQVYFFSAELNGEIVGVDCIFYWNKRYYPLLCGYNKQACPGIGHYMNLVDIEHAISLGAERLDFGETETGMMKEKLFPLVKQFNLTLS